MKLANKKKLSFSLLLGAFLGKGSSGYVHQAFFKKKDPVAVKVHNSTRKIKKLNFLFIFIKLF
jgi:hypothetical protein